MRKHTLQGAEQARPQRARADLGHTESGLGAVTGAKVSERQLKSKMVLDRDVGQKAETRGSPGEGAS